MPAIVRTRRGTAPRARMERTGQKHLLAQLSEIRRCYGASASKRKKTLLSKLRQTPLTNLELLKDYHEQLLFMAAYPDSRELLRLVNSELSRISLRVREVYRSGSAAARELLDDTGIANSHLYCSFSLDAVAWLAERFPSAVDLYWDEAGSAGEELDDFLKEDVLRVEADAVLHHAMRSREIFKLIGGGNSGRALSWLLGRFDQSRARPAIHDRAFEHTAVDTHWHLASKGASRSWIRFPGAVRAFQTMPLTREVDLRSVVRRRIGAPQRLSAKQAKQLIDAARGTLLTRHRETDPVVYSHVDDVELFALEDGVEIALFGARPERRRPLETYVGFVAAKNRVPVAYGGAWILGPAAEIGVNVFDSFRGGESALLFASIMRVYAQRYRVENFFVDPYQFGKENEEGIKSGAFWFYYRLGFRSVEAKLKRLADSEWERISQSNNYRSSVRVLKRLATKPVGIAIANEAAAIVPKIDTAAISLAVCAQLGKRNRGDRERALRDAQRRMRKYLGIPAKAKHPEAIRRAFAELCLVTSLFPSLSRWTRDEKRALAELMLKKGSRKELHYALAVGKHAKFLAALSSLAERGEQLSRRIVSRR